MKILLTVLILFGVSGCAGMLLGSGTTGGTNAPVRGQPQGNANTTADNNVSGILREQFRADQEISQFAIGIRSSSGRVTLTGIVGSYAVRDRIVDIARNTRGVSSVDSRLVVNTNR